MPSDTHFVVEEGTTQIANNVFYNCTNLTSVKIPSSVTRIGSYAFEGCTGLRAVYIDDLSAWCRMDFVSEGGMGWDSGSNPLHYAHNLYLNGEKVTELVIPEDVTAVTGRNFHGGNFTSVTIHSGVKSFGPGVFSGCSELTAVHITDLEAWCEIEYGHYGPSTVFANPLYYARSLYLNGEKITELVIPDGVTRLKDDAFAGGDMTSVRIPNSVTYIGECAFCDCDNLIDIEIPNSVTAIADGAFYRCVSLKGIKNPEGVTMISGELFSECTSLTNVTLHDKIKGIGYYVFYGCSALESFDIPDGITAIYEGTFYGCTSLKSIKIPNSVILIDEDAFYGCSALEDLYVGSSVEEIGDCAFEGCDNLLNITMASQRAIAADESIFSAGAYNNACLYVPRGRKEFYTRVSPWNKFIIREVGMSGVDSFTKSADEAETIYNLNGHVVENPTNGIYIVNGKGLAILSLQSFPTKRRSAPREKSLSDLEKAFVC